jgi:hypothetical protein
LRQRLVKRPSRSGLVTVQDGKRAAYELFGIGDPAGKRNGSAVDRTPF